MFYAATLSLWLFSRSLVSLYKTDHSLQLNDNKNYVRRTRIPGYIIAKTDMIHVHKDDVISSPLEGDSGRQQWQGASGEGQLEKQWNLFQDRRF